MLSQWINVTHRNKNTTEEPHAPIFQVLKWKWTHVHYSEYRSSAPTVDQHETWLLKTYVQCSVVREMYLITTYFDTFVTQWSTCVICNTNMADTSARSRRNSTISLFVFRSCVELSYDDITWMTCFHHCTGLRKNYDFLNSQIFFNLQKSDVINVSNTSKQEMICLPAKVPWWRMQVSLWTQHL